MDAKRWKSAVNLLHVDGCHIDSDGSGAKLVCEEGYMDNEEDWQKSYANHRAAIESCAEFANSKWNVDKDDGAADGAYSTSFWPDDEKIGVR